jgi:hypothetical protein
MLCISVVWHVSHGMGAPGRAYDGLAQSEGGAGRQMWKVLQHEVKRQQRLEKLVALVAGLDEGLLSFYLPHSRLYG